MPEHLNSLTRAFAVCSHNTGNWTLIVVGPPSAGRSEPDFESRGRWFEPRSGHILSLRFGHEKISTTILTLPLIQEGQLSVTGKRMDTN